MQVGLSAVSQLSLLSADREFHSLCSMELGAAGSAAFIQMPRSYLSAAVRLSSFYAFDRAAIEVCEEFSRTSLDDVLPRAWMPNQPSIPQLGTEVADRAFVEFLYPSEGMPRTWTPPSSSDKKCALQLNGRMLCLTCTCCRDCESREGDDLTAG